MSWYAKPSGSYSINSSEGKENARLMASIMVNEFNFTLEASCGAIANSINEGGLNPWRWQDDTVKYTSDWGCGLFGFTSVNRYFTTPGSELMNRSTSTVTSGASADVGSQQTRLMASGDWGWIQGGWRNWSKTQYASQYNIWLRCRNQYGSMNGVTLAQYKQIDNPFDACMVFMCCFEGPGEPNYFEREDDVASVWEVLTDEPLPPIPPRPLMHRKMPIYMMCRHPLHRRF